MGSFLVQVEDWGLHIRLQGALSIERRDEAVRQIEQRCAELAERDRLWSSLIEFDHFQAEDFRPDLVADLMRMARLSGHQRSSILLTDWKWAAAMADAMIAAGTDDQVRIFVRPELEEGQVVHANVMAWVMDGGTVPMVSQAA